MTEINKIGVMFVCLGNICRSPMAEAVFQHIVDQNGLQSRFNIASSGTGSWHIGERPHPGTQAILRERGVTLNKSKRAQQFKRSDFGKYEYILGMDSQNVASLGGSGKARRLLEFGSPGIPANVPDPYYEDNFDYVFDLILESCQGLFAYISNQKEL